MTSFLLPDLLFAAGVLSLLCALLFVAYLAVDVRRRERAARRRRSSWSDWSSDRRLL
jgi:hypothetical protein